jgi:hypothetical protein
MKGVIHVNQEPSYRRSNLHHLPAQCLFRNEIGNLVVILNIKLGGFCRVLYLCCISQIVISWFLCCAGYAQQLEYVE